MNNKYKDCFISILLNTIILIFPFIISFFYKEKIQENTLTVSVAMFLMSIAIGTSEKLIFYTFFIFAFFLVAVYGSIPSTSHIESLWHYQIWLAISGIIALSFDKYDIHVRKGEPLNKF